MFKLVYMIHDETSVALFSSLDDKNAFVVNMKKRYKTFRVIREDIEQALSGIVCYEEKLFYP